ncbi:hypothetical protein Ancab_036927 [Ancistrocladus abbreviatus]
MQRHLDRLGSGNGFSSAHTLMLQGRHSQIKGVDNGLKPSFNSLVVFGKYPAALNIYAESGECFTTYFQYEHVELWNRCQGCVSRVDYMLASNGKLVDSCLEMPVNNFTPPYSFLQVLNQPRGVAKKDQVLGRVHSALKDIAALVPLALSSLLSIL